MRDLDKGYASYVKKYNRKKDRYDSMLSKTEFKDAYEAHRRTIEEQVQTGQITKEQGRKLGKSITATIVSKQTYKFSKERGRVYLDAIKRQMQQNGDTSKAPTLTAVREGKAEKVKGLLSDISERYNELKEQGYSSQDCKELIGQEFFGSA